MNIPRELSNLACARLIYSACQLAHLSPLIQQWLNKVLMTHLEFNDSFTFNARFSFHCLVIHLCYTPLSILNLILEQRCHCMTMAVWLLLDKYTLHWCSGMFSAEEQLPAYIEFPPWILQPSHNPWAGKKRWQFSSANCVCCNYSDCCCHCRPDVFPWWFAIFSKFKGVSTITLARRAAIMVVSAIEAGVSAHITIGVRTKSRC